ncbi:MAG TPA: DUF5670 family protein [Longimicrobium sp.]|jgi:hypothetical protein|nr:DUF5670 family protein [Longimicrobium sp.]
MNGVGFKLLLALAGLLVVLWVLALVVFKVVGFAIHLLLIAALLLVAWAVIRSGASAVRRRL